VPFVLEPEFVGQHLELFTRLLVVHRRAKQGYFMQQTPLELALVQRDIWSQEYVLTTPMCISMANGGRILGIHMKTIQYYKLNYRFSYYHPLVAELFTDALSSFILIHGNERRLEHLNIDMLMDHCTLEQLHTWLSYTRGLRGLRLVAIVAVPLKDGKSEIVFEK